jgi:hypothetical protein
MAPPRWREPCSSISSHATRTFGTHTHCPQPRRPSSTTSCGAHCTRAMRAHHHGAGRLSCSPSPIVTQQRHRTGLHPCRQRGAKSGVTEAACAAIDVRDSWEAARRLWWWALSHACEKHTGVLQCDEARADSERVSEALRLRVISRLSSASQVLRGCSTRIQDPSASLQPPTLSPRARPRIHIACALSTSTRLPLATHVLTHR